MKLNHKRKKRKLLYKSGKIMSVIIPAILSISLIFTGCHSSKENLQKGNSEEKTSSHEIIDLNSNIQDSSTQTSEIFETGLTVTSESPDSVTGEKDSKSPWPAPMELDEETYLATHNLIKDTIAKFGADPKSDQIDANLATLESIDPGQGALWRDIMDYWTYANDEMVVNIDELPDGLPQDDTLCIMILGFELYDNGKMQPELIGRLNVALEAAKKYPNAYILCTGGGTSIANPSVTEADLMGEWLLNNGLEEDRLIIENKSMTTAENALNSYAIILNDYPQIDSIAVLSSSYHIAWGSLLLESSFMKAAYENQTPQIHVISNCAYDCTNAKYSDTLRFETGGMMQLIGEEYLAMLYYSGQIK